jgi:hypothetical protein
LVDQLATLAGLLYKAGMEEVANTMTWISCSTAAADVNLDEL